MLIIVGIGYYMLWYLVRFWLGMNEHTATEPALNDATKLVGI